MATTTIRVRRSFLVRQVEEWIVELPDDLDVVAWQDADPGAFDEHVCDFGRQVTREHRLIDDDQLDTEVIA